MRYTTKLLLAAIAGVGSALGANAAVTITANITSDVTYTAADNPIFLDKQIYVTNGATVTFEAGCVVVTLPGKDGGLVVSQGSQIFVNGTAGAPVIMTSAQDVETWDNSVVVGTGAGITDVTSVGTAPYTSGVHRQVQREWRNLSILGKGVIGASSSNNPLNGNLPNPAIPDGTAAAVLEGLDAGEAGGAAFVAYGGNDDTDDSGSISYISLRYGGRVLADTKELNGLSLGGVGSGTDISHVDIMNNVDDGIEIWGGTVGIKYFNLWNVGDDSFDVDQGWRGKVQFGLIVQGYANPQDAVDNLGKTVDKVQGSGAGDNIFETDGAEDSDAQPVTTAVVYNVTAIGMPNGDGSTTWRDGARVQYRNMMFVDVGEELVRNDGDDGDGASGYGHNGTLDFFAPGNENDIWDTPFDSFSAVNAGAGAFSPANLYVAQVDGFMAEISDSVVFDGTTGATGASGGNLSDSGEQAFNVGVLNGLPGFAQSNALNVYTDTCPIVKYDRSGVPTASFDGKVWTLIAANGLDPRPTASSAWQSRGTAPADGFFTPAGFRGGFSPSTNWAEGWTAADAYGFFANTGTNPADPTATIGLAAKLTVDTVDGEVYTVFESTDGGTTYKAIGTIVGDGTTQSVVDSADFDPTKLYKVEQQ